eukprot:CAMPEP_0116114780 /NCGR_PEP_ID=MMETSP0329-20121206/157_1 /TAXON_ID=697910 /ORGANISM="Pseudo-nitzschia arenysensis, Strain B593" /LENGTH=519 /DNA_ID=CAMNT_0003608171 /DNA_START=68 /DNA_END=1627 /DNA_ORIENTATION=-
MALSQSLSAMFVALMAMFMIANVEAGGVTSKLQITLPMSLRRGSEGYDHREAMFGMPPYGGSIEQNVYYAGADLCDITVDYSKGGYPSRPLNGSGSMESWKSPYILMVDRGDCTFVKKVRHAQKMGATAVILADNTCLCSAGDACVSEGDTFCETKEPVMADDGSGSDVTIPSYLMFKQDADPIKEMLMEDKLVRMKMEWKLPEADVTVEYAVWTTPKDDISRPLMREFRHVAKALGDEAKFTPHMFLYDGMFAGCKSPSGENQCYTLCTNEGRYCSTDPDEDLDKGISGADVVKESLRRICIWKEYGDDGIGMPWWDYVNEFMYRCDSEEYFNNEECVKDCMERSGIQYSKIKICMDDSGGLEGDVENKVLDDEIQEQNKNGVIILPSVFVNNAPLRGAPTTDEVFDAICAGYKIGNEPEICRKCNRCSDVEQCVSAGHCPGEGNLEKVSVPVFAGTLAVVIIVFAILGVVQHRRAKLQMRSQVRGIMAEYMPIDKNATVEAVGIPEDDDFDLQVEIS